jgi:hypothetical protein
VAVDAIIMLENYTLQYVLIGLEYPDCRGLVGVGVQTVTRHCFKLRLQFLFRASRSQIASNRRDQRRPGVLQTAKKAPPTKGSSSLRSRPS